MSENPKQYTIVMHERAARMLYTHVAFVSNVSIQSARALRDKLYKAIKTLATMPLRYPVFRTNNTARTYRQLVMGRYKIIFTVDEKKDVVSIRYILDTRQDNTI